MWGICWLFKLSYIKRCLGSTVAATAHLCFVLLLLMVQVEGDTAKLSDAYYTVQSLTAHVERHVKGDGSLINMLLCYMLDDTTPQSTLDLRYAFSDTFNEDWEPRAHQASSDVAIAAAILDPRFKDKLPNMPAADKLRGGLPAERGQKAAGRRRRCSTAGVYGTTCSPLAWAQLLPAWLRE